MGVNGATDENMPKRTELATGKASAGGAFSQDITFPDSFAPGYYTLEARGLVSGYGSSAIQVVAAAK